MENRIWNQEVGRRINTKQNTDTNRGRGDIGDRSSNLTKLIGAERTSRRDFKYEGTFYVTEDGETYDKEYVDTHKPPRTGVSFYEVSNWIYNEKKEIYEPIIRRIVMIKIKEIQLSLNLDPLTSPASTPIGAGRLNLAKAIAAASNGQPQPTNSVSPTSPPSITTQPNPTQPQTSSPTPLPTTRPTNIPLPIPNPPAYMCTPAPKTLHTVHTRK